ncbi:hypothetical protein OHAE_785 [Ochrobactrum soli]|uniref:Uncharacterized protein n=1 Tax=Ochrobactrum soli TaxID=2448455 RepID=A0A2P9HLE8_9HYPH|nr:hypothetical protein OHAE_785 [[Ochrobactrum] soli]
MFVVGVFMAALIPVRRTTVKRFCWGVIILPGIESAKMLHFCNPDNP